MRRIMAPVTDTIATVSAVTGRGIDVIRTATHPLRALEDARLFLLRLTGRTPAGLQVANMCRVQPAVGVAGAARLLGSKYCLSMAWPRLVRRPCRRGASTGRS